MSEIRPNVLIITLDQWRADCLSVVGHPCLRTPHLDRLAADAVLFRRHYTQASPCGPARASLFTGLYAHNHRSVRNGIPLDDRHTNLAREARRLGYDPVLFGYTDTSVDPRLYSAGDPALETYEGVLPGFTPALILSMQHGPWLVDLARKGYAIPTDAKDIWLPREVGTSTPGPTFAPTPYNAMYDPAAVPPFRRAEDRKQESAQHPWLAYHLARSHAAPLPEQRQPLLGALDDDALRQLRATYYGMISQVDDELGRLLNALRESGAYERTLIVITADHGEQLGDHWMIGKDGYFDAAFHIPLLIRDPRPAPRGLAVDDFTEAIDIMPTVLDFLGLAIPPQLDGQSLAPFLAAQIPANWRREVHWEYDFRDLRSLRPETALGLASEECSLAVIRDKRYKYVHFAGLPTS